MKGYRSSGGWWLEVTAIFALPFAILFAFTEQIGALFVLSGIVFFGIVNFGVWAWMCYTVGHDVPMFAPWKRVWRRYFRPAWRFFTLYGLRRNYGTPPAYTVTGVLRLKLNGYPEEQTITRTKWPPGSNGYMVFGDFIRWYHCKHHKSLFSVERRRSWHDDDAMKFHRMLVNRHHIAAYHIQLRKVRQEG